MSTELEWTMPASIGYNSGSMENGMAVAMAVTMAMTIAMTRQEPAPDSANPLPISLPAMYTAPPFPFIVFPLRQRNPWPSIFCSLVSLGFSESTFQHL